MVGVVGVGWMWFWGVEWIDGWLSGMEWSGMCVFMVLIVVVTVCVCVEGSGLVVVRVEPR